MVKRPRIAGVLLAAAVAALLGAVGAAGSGTAKTPPPRITSFSPLSGLPGDVVTVDGTGFAGVTAVRFNGKSAAFAVDSPTELHATVPTGSAPGRIAIVTPSGTATSPGSFHVIRPPKISFFRPLTGGLNTVFRIHGSDLDTATLVTLAGEPITLISYGDHGILTARIEHPVTGKLEITNPAGTGAPSATFRLVTLVDHAEPAVGLPGDPFTIRGSMLADVTDVRMGGSSIPFTVIDDWTIDATATTHIGNGRITLYKQGKAVTTGCCFSRFSPPAAKPVLQNQVRAVGEVVELGPYFTPHLSVKQDGGPTVPVVLGDDGPEATVPVGWSTGRLRYVNPAGAGPQSADLLVVAPRIGSFSPVEGPVGSVVEITGTNFKGTKRVLFDDTTPAAFTVVNDTTVRAIVPPGALSGHLTVVTCTGSRPFEASGRSDDRFRVTFGGSAATPTDGRCR